jgi:hypothetical protein
VITRALFGLLLVYVGLWGLTQVVGSAQVRAAVAERYIPVADCPRLRACHWDAVAVAPFLVKAEYFWDSGTLAGGGANLLYAWFGLVRLQVFEWNTIAI